MTDDQQRDYTEFIHIFLNTDDNINQKGAVATMVGHVENAIFMNRAKEKSLKEREHYKAIKVAQKMIDKYKTDEEIHELTGLPFEEIKNLRNINK